MASKKDKKADETGSKKPKKAKGTTAPAVAAPASTPAATPAKPIRKRKGVGSPSGGWADGQIQGPSREGGALQVKVLNGLQVQRGVVPLVEFFAPTSKDAPPVNGQFRVTLSLSDDPDERNRQLRDLDSMLNTFLRLWNIESGVVARCESTPNSCDPNSNVASNGDKGSKE